MLGTLIIGVYVILCIFTVTCLINEQIDLRIKETNDYIDVEWFEIPVNTYRYSQEYYSDSPEIILAALRLHIQKAKQFDSNQQLNTSIIRYLPRSSN